MPIENIKAKMQQTIDAFTNNLKTVRTGRASAHIFDSVNVSAYGSEMPLNQVATISVPDASMIMIQVWDKQMVAAVEKAIQNANLGFSPIVDGPNVRVPVPPLSEERRNEFVKICANYLEQAKIAIRNIRRDGIDEIKKKQKNSEISEDEMHDKSAEVQKITDEKISEADKIFEVKKIEITTV